MELSIAGEGISARDTLASSSLHLCLGLLELGPRAHLVKNLQEVWILELGADRGSAVILHVDQTHLI
jgi:hypothetical protein